MTLFCKDCKWYTPEPDLLFRMHPPGLCSQPDVIKVRQDEENLYHPEDNYLVTGVPPPPPKTITHDSARKARREYGRCGLDGTLWEAVA